MDYETIKIKKLSAPVLRRLQKGMRVKVSKGGDMAIAVDPKKMKHVQKAFSNNKGAYLSLTPTELQTNMKIIGKGREKIGLRADDIPEYAKNPLLLGYDASTGVLPVVAPKKTKEEDVAARKRVAKGRKEIKKVGKYLNPVSLVGMMGGGLYAQPRGAGLYAQPEESMRGRGTRLLDQKFSAREGINFFGKELPRAFKGGALQRNTQHMHASDVGVGGTLLSDFEQHPAMRSQPFHTGFAGSRTLPIPFQKFHNTPI